MGGYCCGNEHVDSDNEIISKAPGSESESKLIEVLNVKPEKKQFSFQKKKKINRADYMFDKINDNIAFKEAG